MQLTLPERLRRRISLRIPVDRRRLPLARGCLSITFDDFPKSAWEVGGPVLADHGVKATYYASGGLCGRTFDGLEQYGLDDLLAAHQAGHEIGCHTYDHFSGQRHSAEAYLASVERNKVFMRERIPGLAMRSFAYPYGHAPLAHRRRMSGMFATCRGVGRGLNGPIADRTLLASVGLELRQRKLYSLERIVEDAAERKLWLILFTHDVSERPSEYGCTPSELDAALRLTKAAGLDILPIGAMIPYLVSESP
jgi:peptidoglycan/xylan/chitin deacetylase (PgdA/CDA1 family)